MSQKTVECGVFIPVGQGGWIMSSTSPETPATYAYNKQVTQLAESLGMDFVLSMAKWRGFGGVTHHWDVTLESLTAMTALSEATSRIKLWCTLHTMVFHPAVAAKMIATFDQASNGRAGINLVAGSNPSDQGQMGLWKSLDMHGRYALAREWTTVAKGLWREERFTFKGDFFEVEDCMSNPKPIQQPHPPILCAATSDVGFDFVIDECDIAFMGAADASSDRAMRAKEMAADRGKKTGVYGLMMMIPGETDAEAQARVDLYNQGVDLEAMANRTREYTADTPENSMVKKVVASATAGKAVNQSAFIGSEDTIVERLLETIDRLDLDGVVFTFGDFIKDLEFFGQRILPRLSKVGLRFPAFEEMQMAVAR
jgi:pyrimidine oxygenase